MIDDEIIIGLQVFFFFDHQFWVGLIASCYSFSLLDKKKSRVGALTLCFSLSLLFVVLKN
jgi:hypothetical protein